MSDKERLEFLEDVLGQIKRSFPWMLKSLQHSADETSGGNYSPEMKHAIACNELLELV